MKPAFGFVNEYRVIEELSLKKVKDIKENLKDMLYALYADLNEDDIINASHCEKGEKADMCIEIRGIKKYVSIKYGDKNSVHTEELKNFKRFILYNNCGWDIMEKYLYYHYADGTLDGTGSDRISVAEYKLTHSDKIAEINKVFNRKKVLNEAYQRFLFRGIIPNGNTVDAILHCKNNDRLYATREEVFEYLHHKAYMQSSGVHFSRLFVQPLARNLNYSSKYEIRRHYIQIKWFDLYIAMSEIKHKRKTGKWLDVIV